MKLGEVSHTHNIGRNTARQRVMVHTEDLESRHATDAVRKRARERVGRQIQILQISKLSERYWQLTDNAVRWEREVDHLG
jgi:hypothetical protein